MLAGTRTIGELFKQDRRLVVPLFQRPYVWSQEAQWEPLWDDIRMVAERLFDGQEARPHFVGAVVLDQSPKPTGFLESRLIIDGQQRLTTLQLILEAYADNCEMRVRGGSDQLANYSRALRKLTRNDDVFQEDADGEYKVWPTNADQGVFRLVMECSSPHVLTEELRAASKNMTFNPRISEGYSFFYWVIGEWLDASDDEEAAAAALFRTLNEYIRIVVIDLEKDDDAQLIFETLNARGTPLLPADLVKNHLLHRAAAEKENIDELYKRYWSPFDDSDAYWRAEIGVGHAKRARVDTFLQHYLAMALRGEVTSAHLYTDYRYFVRNSGESTQHHLAELCRFAEIYRSFDHEPRETPEGEFFALLQTLGITSAYPFLLALFARADVSVVDRRLVLRHLASFLVRRLVCHLSTRAYNKFFIALLDATVDAPDIAAAVHDYLAGGSAEGTRWPADDEFTVAWMGNKVYRVIRQDRIRFVLEMVENQLRGPKTETLIFGNKLTIEHLMPQKWQDYYPLPEGVDSAEAELARESIIHTFGNLTLLTQALNPSVSNGPWGAPDSQGKRDQILAHSALALNRDLPSTWDEVEIRKRARTLLVAAKSIWSAPALTQ